MANVLAPLVDLGPRSTPQEIKDIRQSAYDFHFTYGMPVIHKHRWTLRDVAKGLARKCPFHDNVAYSQDLAGCSYCFGTGILGGWADGILVNVTFSDVVEDRLRVGPTGVIMFDREPQLVAPWIPDMGNGDMIITLELSADAEQIQDTLDRFIMKDVTPVTIRGFQTKVQTVEYKVKQQAMIDRVPDGDIYYDVPIIFDYGSVPDPGGTVGTVTSTTVNFGVQGVTGHFTEVLLGLRTTGLGTGISTTLGFRISADAVDPDVHFHFNEN